MEGAWGRLKLLLVKRQGWGFTLRTPTRCESWHRLWEEYKVADTSLDKWFIRLSPRVKVETQEKICGNFWQYQSLENFCRCCTVWSWLLWLSPTRFDSSLYLGLLLFLFLSQFFSFFWMTVSNTLTPDIWTPSLGSSPWGSPPSAFAPSTGPSLRNETFLPNSASVLFTFSTSSPPTLHCVIQHGMSLGSLTLSHLPEYHLDWFRFCGTHFTTYQQFVVNKYFHCSEQADLVLSQDFEVHRQPRILSCEVTEAGREWGTRHFLNETKI